MPSMSRLNKRLKAVLLGCGVLVAMVAVVLAAIWLTHTQTAELGNAEARCQNVHQQAYTVNFEQDRPVPAQVTANRCDTITFANKDPIPRLIAFGPHEHHVSYDGVSERLLNQNQQFTITLIATGTYYFHDHIHDEAHGSFTVR